MPDPRFTKSASTSAPSTEGQSTQPVAEYLPDAAVGAPNTEKHTPPSAAHHSLLAAGRTVPTMSLCYANINSSRHAMRISIAQDAACGAQKDREKRKRRGQRRAQSERRRERLVRRKFHHEAFRTIADRPARSGHAQSVAPQGQSCAPHAGRDRRLTIDERQELFAGSRRGGAPAAARTRRRPESGRSAE
jgi:hypothetical protein